MPNQTMKSLFPLHKFPQKPLQNTFIKKHTFNISLPFSKESTVTIFISRKNAAKDVENDYPFFSDHISAVACMSQDLSVSSERSGRRLVLTMV